MNMLEKRRHEIMKTKKPKVTEILHHLGEEDLPFGAVNPPIFQTSIFSFKTFADFKNALKDEKNSYIYSRGNNPTVNLVEEKIAELEHGEKAKLVSSGVAAISGSMMAFLKSGDHVISVRDVYGWTKTLLEKYLKRFNVSFSYVEGTDPEEIEKNINKNTKIIYLESPTTFSFKIQNLKQIAKIAKKHGIKTIIDNSWATPIFQNPIDYGIDLVVHSVSKYIGGHSDVVAGAIIGKEEDIAHIFKTEFQNIGTVPDPFMAWLVLRGLRTLHIRMRVHYENTLKIIDFLKNEEKIAEINYPFFKENPQFKLAKEQMRGGSGLFSFKIKTNSENNIAKFTDSLKYFRRAVSWGGYESLIIPYAVTLCGDNDKDRLSLVRVHIGLEESELLIDDLKQALSQINL
ncbi:MAG: bifunctional L-alanine/L-glutamate racemase [Atribacterota bacterium]|jgi:cystathionine beta-lyase|nr:bifunctional L-alanine/L-glutamate racemase [Atribacterota bacterium]